MPKKKSTSTERRKRPPPPAIRRTSSPRAGPESEPEPEKGTWRQAVSQRFQNMGASHVATGVAAGTIGNAVGVTIVGLGWARPKPTAVAMMGSGAAATTAGYVWEADHLMSVGLGLTAAGTFSLANQYAVDAYEAIERRSKEKKSLGEKSEGKADRKTEKAGQRNASPHLRVVTAGSDDDNEDYEDEDYDTA